MNKNQALTLLAEQALCGDLIFSASVATSLKVQEAIDEGDCSLELASKVILNEPLLAAKVVSVANSVAFMRSGSQVTNVRSAIARIGFNNLRAIVSAVVMKQIAGASKNIAIRSKINQLWEHSAQVAALSQVLARRVTKCNPDTAMFAGIVHEVGGFYILSRAEEFPCLLEPDNYDMPPLEDDLNVNTFIERDSKESIIGRAVLKNLNMPVNILEAADAIWYGMRAMPPETLGDILLLANELARTPSPLDTRTDSPNNRCDSEIDFVVGEGTLQSILEESEDEVHSLTAALIV